MKYGYYSSGNRRRAYRVAAISDRTQLSSAMRSYVEIRDNNRCVYCGETATEIDHVLPVSKGGRNFRGNLVACCNRCNTEKRVSIDPIWLTTAFRHLISKEESLEWLDTIPEAFQGD